MRSDGAVSSKLQKRGELIGGGDVTSSYTGIPVK